MKKITECLLMSYLCLTSQKTQGMNITVEQTKSVTRASSVGVITEEQYSQRCEIQITMQQILFAISEHMYDCTLLKNISSIPCYEKALNTRNNDGNTPLSYMFKKLNDDLNEWTKELRNQAITEEQKTQIINNMKNLISLGANPKLVNEYGRSLADQTHIYFKDTIIGKDILELLKQHDVFPSKIKAKTPDVKHVKIKQFNKGVIF